MLKSLTFATTLLCLVSLPAFAASVGPTARQLSAMRNAGVPVLQPTRLPAGFAAAELILAIDATPHGAAGALLAYLGPHDQGFGIEFVADGIGSMDYQTAPKFEVNMAALGDKFPVRAYLEPIQGGKPSWISDWIVTPKGACRLLGCGQVRSSYDTTWANNEISAADAKLVLSSIRLE